MPDKANQDTTRAAIYTRVSTGEQVRGTSLDTQLERCQAYATARGWDVTDEYRDGGESGAMAARRALDRLLEACRRGEVDAVVVAKLDRFGRSNRHLAALLGELDDQGIAFVSVAESIDSSTPSGRFLRTLLSGAAEFERDMILERTTAGLRSKAASGRWPGGPAPYGFELLDKGTGSARLGINEDEAAVLRRAVELIVDEGHTTWSTARVLNQLGLPPRKSARWVHQNLRRTLHSPTLGGTWVYESREGPIEVEVPAILEPERFAALRDALDAASTGPKDPAGKRYYLLSRGRLIGMCGASYHGAWRRERESRSYRCNNSRPEAEPRCLDHNINADMVEQTVWSEVAAMLSEPERLTQMADDYLGLQDAQTGAHEDQLVAVDRKLAALREARTDRVAQALKAGVDPTVLRDAVAELGGDERALLAHRARLEEWREAGLAGSVRARRLQDLAISARKRMARMGPEDKRAVLDLLDVRATVTGWAECENCEGRGRIKGGPGGKPCPTCWALRRIPSLRVEGVVLENLSVVGGEATSAPGLAIPFAIDLARHRTGRAANGSCAAEKIRADGGQAHAR